MVIGDPAKLWVEEVENRSTAFALEHVPILAEGVHQAQNFPVGQSRAGRTGFQGALDDEPALARIAYETAAFATLSPNMVDSVQLIEIAVSQKPGNAGAQLFWREFSHHVLARGGER